MQRSRTGRLRRVLTTVGTMAAAGALVGTMSTEAYAANLEVGTVGTSSWTSGAGVARYQEYGDYLTLSDRAADGASVYGFLTDMNDKTLRAKTFSGGAGSSRTWNFNLPEGKQIFLYVCLKDNGEIQDTTCKFYRGRA
ncbi:hypothetical protein [Streptomyces sp. WMMB303]|uniref:hypothetical protein n=1 Tax=Streptomyces sp. WMMB303 TaxID=3034154 RepID=UPI0023EC2D41|nr:hypothetical protein [Streptomyces sp. WMMB303]MDF4250767.1 hypothetical protein [Streptomyces sp. WMMB303]